MEVSSRKQCGKSVPVAEANDRLASDRQRSTCKRIMVRDYQEHVLRVGVTLSSLAVSIRL